MKVMIISPHPDDETLGAGGTLLKLKDGGNEIFWVNVTNMSTDYGYSEDRVRERDNEIRKVKEAYGFDGFWNFELEPAGLDKYETGELVKRFKEVIDEVKPEFLILPYGHDVHSDHKIVFEAAYSCTKAFRAPYLKTVLCMEILSETDQAQNENVFAPNVFIDITNYIDKKIEIMKTYKSEIDAPPFPRNQNAIKGLAAYRGVTAFQEYSESFRLVRGIMG